MNNSIKLDEICNLIYELEHYQDRYFKTIKCLIDIEGDSFKILHLCVSKLIHIGNAIKYERQICHNLIQKS